MKQETHKVCGKEIIFQKITVGERMRLKFRLLNIFGDVDLGKNKDKDTISLLFKTLTNLDPDVSIKLMTDVCTMSIAAPPMLGKDANKTSTESFDSFIDDWEGEESAGEEIYYKLFFQALEVQFGGVIDSLGKQLGFSVKSLKDTFKEKYSSN